jgi:uncharacterized protein (TIGR02118 family)
VMKKGMIKVSVFYPGGEDIFFDMDYYSNQHMAMVRELLGDALKESSVERGISGGAPGSIPHYAALAGLYFESMEAFDDSFGRNAAKIMADVSRFTNSKALIQISEVIF